MAKYNEKISVRNLVEFLLRSGDIDNTHGAFSDMEAMRLGAAIHRKIQRSMGSTYRMEVPLAVCVPFDEFDIIVEGRADGIIEDDEICIDEIKGIYKDPEKLEEPVPVHLAQAKCYAYIYSLDNELSEISVQMTYVNMETESIKRFKFGFSFEELKNWFNELINEYYRWVKFKYDWRIKRNESIKKLEFPYPYREGQKEAAAGVYRTIVNNKKLFLMAPTGVGKTLAVIFPSVKAMGEGHGENIFYLTAKTITRTAAGKAFDLLRNKGLDFKLINITAKEKICFMDETECDPKICPYAKGHYDRINEAVFDLLLNEDSCDRQIIEEYAEKHKVCPFEMSLDLSLWVDAVICDYNYLFDPNASLRRFFADGVKGDYIFLIDEAHNLVERGRNMYSASLIKEDFLKVKRLIGDKDPKLKKQLEKCNQIMLEWKRECEDYRIIENIGAFSLKLLNVFSLLEDLMDEISDGEVKKEVLDFYFKIREFLYIFDLYDEKYVIYTENTSEGFMIRLFNVDPSNNLELYLEKGISTIFFSATFLPIKYYRKLLSVRDDDYTMYVPSPFPNKNRFTAVINDVTTKYTNRSEDMYSRYAAYIKKAVTIRPGNYIAFFPSYAFLEKTAYYIEQEFKDLYDLEKILIQNPKMTESEKEEFIRSFENERNLLGLCVMAGSFAEGIDLTNESLIGAFIVGTGLPMVCNERDILKKYFDDEGLNGFEYAYLFSGMNHVLQSAGRVIRTAEDKGMILLMDERFERYEYRNLFPKEWSDIRYINADILEDAISNFWNADCLYKLSGKTWSI